jgi:hypothetical protein
VGVDVEGRKHLLGIQEGTTENAAAVKDLLERLAAQRVDPNRRRLFVIDGSKALRTQLTSPVVRDCGKCRRFHAGNPHTGFPGERPSKKLQKQNITKMLFSDTVLDLGRFIPHVRRYLSLSRSRSQFTARICSGSLLFSHTQSSSSVSATKSQGILTVQGLV